jgi:hypothetical protein
MAVLMSQTNYPLLNSAKSQLVLQGSSLAEWCEENRLTRQWVTAVLRGDRNGPTARKLRLKIIKKLNLEVAE